MSANLEDFYKALKSGKSDAKAAFSTWLGKQAQKAGFNHVEVRRETYGIEATFTKQ